MKVLIISHMYPSTFNEVGGIFVHQQVQELQKQGCEVKVVSPTPWSPFLIKHLSKKWKRYSDIPVKMTWDGIDVWNPRFILKKCIGEKFYLKLKQLYYAMKFRQ